MDTHELLLVFLGSHPRGPFTTAKHGLIRAESDNLVSHASQPRHMNKKRRRHRKRNTRRKNHANSSSGASVHPGKGSKKVKKTRRGARRGTMQMLEGMAKEGGILSLSVSKNPEKAKVDGIEDVSLAENSPKRAREEVEVHEPSVGKVWCRYDHESETYASVVTIMRVDRQSNLVLALTV